MSWTRLTDSSNATKRWGAGTFQIGGKQYIIGGCTYGEDVSGGIGIKYADTITPTTGIFSNNLWQYDPVTDVWTQKYTYPGTANWGGPCFSIGTKGYFGRNFGIYAGDEVPSNPSNPSSYLIPGADTEFWEYDSGTNTWVQVNPAPTAPKAPFPVWTVGATYQIYTRNHFIPRISFSIGDKGYTTSSKEGELTFWEYDPLDDTFSQKASYPDPLIEEFFVPIPAITPAIPETPLGVCVAPSASPAGGSYGSMLSGINGVALSSTTPISDIRYTVNGDEPTVTSALYATKIPITTTTTLKAKTYKTNYTDSITTTEDYIIADTCALPMATPTAGTYNATQVVSLLCSTPSTAIYYTTNGDAPVSGISLRYTAPITITATTNLKAIATRSAYTNSLVMDNLYTIAVATPVASVSAGTYYGTQTVTLSTTTSGAQIRYTLNGDTPTPSSTLYSGAISITATTTLKAIATKALYANSEVMSNTYTLILTVNSVISGNVGWHFGFSIDSKGYVGGGLIITQKIGPTLASVSYTNSYSDSFYQYDPLTNVWTAKNALPTNLVTPETYYGPPTVTWNTKGYPQPMPAASFSSATRGYAGLSDITGYYDGVGRNFYEYNPTTDAWTRLTDFLGTSRTLPTGFVLNDFVYICFGYDINYKVKNDLWRFDLTVPQSVYPPTLFTALALDKNRIKLTWVKGTSSDKTIILRKIGSYPVDINDGTEVYFSTGMSFTDTGLIEGTSYYYRAWGENTGVYSNTYASDNATTPTTEIPPTCSTSAATEVGTVSATLNGDVITTGYPADVTYWFEYGTTVGLGQETAHQNGIGYPQVVSGLITELIPESTYYFRLVVDNVTDRVNGLTLSFVLQSGNGDYKTYIKDKTDVLLEDKITYPEEGSTAQVLTKGAGLRETYWATPNIGAGIDIEEGTQLVNIKADTLRFTGDGISITDMGAGRSLIDITSNWSGIDVKQEGVIVAPDAIALDFRGSGLTITNSGGGVSVIDFSSVTALDEKVKASSDDPTNGYLDSKIKRSLVIDAEQVQLSGDEETPGASKYYGTDGTSAKGFHVFPSSIGTFVALTDTPNAYTGQSGLVVKVNAAETALVFEKVSGGSGMGSAENFTDLLDVPNSYTGKSGIGVRVNATETGLEFFDRDGSGTDTDYYNYNFFRSPGTSGLGIDGFREVFSNQTVDKVRIRLTNTSSTDIYATINRGGTPILTPPGLCVPAGDYSVSTIVPAITDLNEFDVLTCDITQGNTNVSGINVSLRTKTISGGSGGGGGSLDGVDVEKNSTPIVSEATIFRFSGIGVNVSDLGGGRALVDIAGNPDIGIDIEKNTNLITSKATIIRFTGTTANVVNSGGGRTTIALPEPDTYDIAGETFGDKIECGADVMKFQAVRAFTFPIDMVGSVASCALYDTAPQAIYTLLQNELAFGQFVFTSGITTAVFNCASGVSFTINDILKVRAPLTPLYSGISNVIPTYPQWGPISGISFVWTSYIAGIQDVNWTLKATLV